LGIVRILARIHFSTHFNSNKVKKSQHLEIKHIYRVVLENFSLQLNSISKKPSNQRTQEEHLLGLNKK